MADYGLQVFSDVNGNKLFDSTEPFKGMATVASGTVSAPNTYSRNDYDAGVVYDEDDLVFFRPSFINSGTLFLVSGRTIEYTTDTYKVFFKIKPVYGTAPTTVDYVVLRPMDNVASVDDYGLKTFDYVGGYTIRTFDSTIFTTKDELQIDNVWDYRFSHTASFGSATNNDEWYSTSSLQMISATLTTFDVGLVYSRLGTSTGWNAGGPFPNTFTGPGIFHYGQNAVSPYYQRFESDYYIRAKQVFGN